MKLFHHIDQTEIASEAIDEFPHTMALPFLLWDDSQEARDQLARWMYVHNAAAAYKGYRVHGPGFVIGPFATRRDVPVSLLTAKELRPALSSDDEVVLLTSFIGVSTARFREVILEPPIRERILSAPQYEPETQVALLLLRDGQLHTFLPRFASEALRCYAKVTR
jgi:hypothetical protein